MKDLKQQIDAALPPVWFSVLQLIIYAAVPWCVMLAVVLLCQAK
jgi:hypothetical protein